MSGVRAVDVRDLFRVHRTAEGDAAALQGVTVSLEGGQLLCVLGPSGAGKSTLLRVLAGLEPPSAGAVRIDGTDIGRLPERQRITFRRDAIGFIGERSSTTLPPDLPVGDCVALPLRLRGAKRPDVRARAGELLSAVGLADRSASLPGELSGGERQRVALCVAIAHRPALLLADEPTGELDRASADQVRRAMADLVHRFGLSAIVVSHDPESAVGADRVVRMRDGRIVEDRRGDQEDGLVLGRGGWLRLPPELLAQAGIGRRVSVRQTPGGLLISGAGDEAAAPLVSAPETRPLATSAEALAVEVEVEGVTRALGRGAARRQVLARFGAVFAPGRLTVVTGRSGSGKTTLLRLLAGLDRPDAGQIAVGGTVLGELDDEQLAGLRRTQIGYLAQEASPIAFLSARENVELALSLRGVPREEADERTATVMSAVGLADRASQLVRRLSAGERQRVALARAIAGARGLLIVDEPTSRLDEAMTVAVAELLAGTGQTVICATHDPLVVARADVQLSL